MEIDGLPLHPLVVHATVALVPLAAVLALASLVPPWRLRLRWPLVVVAVLGAGAVVLAYLSGNSFREANDFFNDPSLPVTEQIDEHENYGSLLLWVMLGFTAVALLDAARANRPGALRVVLDLLLVAGAVAILVLAYLTGEAGARAVWGEGFSG